MLQTVSDFQSEPYQTLGVQFGLKIEMEIPNNQTQPNPIPHSSEL